ncbi:MAG: hypothetical protein GWP02_06470 [Desulfobulbaceae bacterium]|nr:hypothetical protein [Desulfobulbaceae bacterium]
MNNIRWTTLAVLAFFLGACGSSSDLDESTPPLVGSQSTNLTAAGRLTGFGSIYVNGIEFETDSASYEVDDIQKFSDADLSVGMFVTVRGTVNSDGVSGTAESVSYDDELEGPVENITPDPAGDATERTFTTFGTTVVINTETVFDSEDGSAFGFGTIANGDNVEISGEYQGDTLHAWYVEKQDAADDDYEAKGTISAFNGADQFTLTLDHGGTLNVTLAAGAEIPTAGIVDDQYVEVEGTIPDPVGFPNDFLANKVELEDHDSFDDTDDEVEMKGALTLNLNDEANPDDDTWTINDTLIVFDASTSYEPASLADAIADGSADGRVVEVEGHYVDNALHADEVKDEEDDLEFKAFVEAVSPTDAKNGTITIAFPGAMGGIGDNGQLDIIVSGGTFYMDDDAVSPFDLNSLPAGTLVEFHARMDAGGNIVASTLEIEDGTGTEIEGLVDAIDDATITVMTIIFNIVDGTTMFKNGVPVAGDYVSVKDENADGTADIIELDD